MGEMMMFILSAFANMERENIKERVKDNMIALAKKGCFTGGFVPFGCEIEKKEGKSYLTITDEKTIQLIFNKYLELKSLYALKKYLLDNKINSLSTRSSLGRLLRNPIYCKSNSKVSNYFESKGYEVVRSPNKKGYMTYGKTSNYPTLIVGKHKACIEADIFLKVNILLDENKEVATKKESKTYWLTEVLYCPYCNSKYVLVNSGRNAYYVCQNRLNRGSRYLNANLIEEKISYLIRELEDDNYYNYFKKDNVDTNKEEIEVLENVLSKNKAAIGNLVEKLMILSNEASIPVTRKIEELTTKNLELENKIYELKTIELAEIKSKEENEIKSAIKRFKDLKSNKEKRENVRIIFKKLKYDPYKDSINIEF